MTYRLLGIAPVAALAATSPPTAGAGMLPGKSSTVGIAQRASLRTDTVEYRDGDQLLDGYVAWDESKAGLLPGVLPVHEWNGSTEHTHEQAQRLAELGYVAFAADIYGKRHAPGHARGGRRRGRLPCAARAAMGRREPHRGGGYCFGGTGVLELARTGADLRDIVSAHGGLDSPNPVDGRNIKAKVPILRGAEDPLVPCKDVDALLDELRAAKVDWEMVTYGGAVHVFTNPAADSDPGNGAVYEANADYRSWVARQEFLDEVFR